MPYEHPNYPKELTKSDWDKKKGVIAKVQGKTGVGAAMAKCQKLYKAVDWNAIELGKNTLSVRNYSVKAWEGKLKEAKSEVKGNLRKLVVALYALRDIANKAGDKFKKSKTISRKDTKRVKDIAVKADFLGVSLNANSLGSYILKDYQALIDKFDGLAANLPKILKKVLARTPAEIKKMKNDYSPANFNKVSMKAARDITQNLGNIVKFNKNFGYAFDGVDMPKTKKLCDTFVGWGNANSFFKNSTDEKIVKKEVEKFEKGYKSLKSMFG